MKVDLKIGSLVYKIDHRRFAHVDLRSIELYAVVFGRAHRITSLNRSVFTMRVGDKSMQYSVGNIEYFIYGRSPRNPMFTDAPNMYAQASVEANEVLNGIHPQ
jgi:hypothetical protein